MEDVADLLDFCLKALVFGIPVCILILYIATRKKILKIWGLGLSFLSIIISTLILIDANDDAKITGRIDKVWYWSLLVGIICLLIFLLLKARNSISNQIESNQ